MNEKFYKALKIFTAFFGIIVWILLILPERWSLTAESEMRIMSFFAIIGIYYVRERRRWEAEKKSGKVSVITMALMALMLFLRLSISWVR